MPPRKRVTPNKVDEPVKNQENPGTSETERESTEAKVEEASVPEMPKPFEVDETVVNQENPGTHEPVDRNPDPQIVEDVNGVPFNISKSHPELVDPDAEENEVRRTKIRQDEAVMNAKDLVESDSDNNDDKFTIEFVETGLTAQGRVWKKGQTLDLATSGEARKAEEDSDGKVWYELTADQQQERYGKVFFEKR